MNRFVLVYGNGAVRLRQVTNAEDEEVLESGRAIDL